MAGLLAVTAWPVHAETPVKPPVDPASKSEKPAKKERANIAVMDFNDIDVSKNVAIIVSNAVRTALFDTRRFNVLEQSSMEAILQEQAFQKSGCTTAECAVEIGKLLNMKFMVFGDVTFLGNKSTGVGEYTVSVRVVDVETRKIVANKDVSVTSQTALRSAAKEGSVAIAGMIGGDQELMPDSGGFFQDVLTILGIIGAFAGAALAGQ